MSLIVLTLIGPDRAGLVELVAHTIAEHGANWLESRMSHLAGQFAGILQVDTPSEQTEDLVEALRRLAGHGLQVVIQASESAQGPEPERAFQLELVGQDRPGIVRDISRAIAASGVNVEELATGCSPAPMSGEMLFSASARLGLPAGVSLDDLRARLEAIAEDLVVELRLEQREPR